MAHCVERLVGDIAFHTFPHGMLAGISGKAVEHAVEFFNGEIVEEIEVEYVDKAFVVGIGFDGLTGECNFFFSYFFEFGFESFLYSAE